MASKRVIYVRALVFASVAAMLLGMATPAAGQPGGGRAGENEEDDGPRPPVTITPSNLLQSGDRTNIERIVNELAAFDATVGVVVQRIDAPAEDTQATAEELYEDGPVETAPEAGDGLLILVEIPQGAHQATTIGFAAGPNFYPRGGITPERLASLVATEAQPLIDRNNIGDAIVTLMQWIAVVQLFEPSPRIELTERQRPLNDLLDRVAAPILALLALALAGFGWWTGHRTRRYGGKGRGEEATALDAVQAGALARGRVDDAVLTGALLQLHAHGAATLPPSSRSEPALRLLDPSQCHGTSDLLTWDAAAPLANPAMGHISPDRLRQLPDAWGGAAAGLERELQGRDLLDHRARRADALVTLLAMLGAAAALLLVIPTLIARASVAIGAEILLLAMAFLVWWWTKRRSWTTAIGASALHSWREAHTGDDPQRLIYDVITRQDRAPDNRFVTVHGPLGELPFRPVNSLIATVRNFGRI
jgi:uncharacterized protein (TIGR04222 family)